MSKATGETIWWSLFAAGGVVVALVVPVLIFVTGIAIPFVQIGAVPSVQFAGFAVVARLIWSVLGRLFLFVAISLPLFHCAHRIVHTSKDIGLRAAHSLFAALFYGGAIVGTAVALYLTCLP